MADSKKKSIAKLVERPKTFYVGPTIPKFGLIRNTNYVEITPTIEAAMEETPEIRALFITLPNYPIVAKDIAAGEHGTHSGGFYFQTFNKVAAKYGSVRLGKLKLGGETV